MSLLEIKNLQLDFVSHDGSARAVDGVSLTLAAGETVCLVGESGCGKSVTAQSIARLVPTPPARYAAGEILLNGRDVLKMSEDGTAQHPRRRGELCLSRPERVVESRLSRRRADQGSARLSCIGPATPRMRRSSFAC
jgi:ABC-type glutathione transport system ATPase component